MSKKPITHVAFVIDRSGSMQRTQKEAIDGFNGQLEEIKANSDTQDIRCSLVSFNHEVHEHMWDKPASELQAATYESFRPQGWTALYDAMGYTVDKLMKETDSKEESTTYLVFIISDGQENYSQHYDVGKVASLIQEAESTKKWTISYMGCSKTDIEKLSKNIGIKMSNMATWENQTAEGTSNAMKGTRSKFRGYFSKKLTCSEDYSTLSDNFQSDESGVVADYVGVEFTDESLSTCNLDKADVFGVSKKAF